MLHFVVKKVRFASAYYGAIEALGIGETTMARFHQHLLLLMFVLYLRATNGPYLVHRLVLNFETKSNNPITERGKKTVLRMLTYIYTDIKRQTCKEIDKERHTNIYNRDI